jgi:tRNA A-37 threonylcarbamoyl transferase component Bud32
VKDFVSDDFARIMEQHGLQEFDDLWQLDLPVVDEANWRRGGWSSVFRLELSDVEGNTQGFYIKRQENHFTRTWRHPFGQATFAREMANIRLFAQLGIPALEAVYFAQRNEARRAILVTRGLDDYQPLEELQKNWQQLEEAQRSSVVSATAEVVGLLHRNGIVHNCLYPKHLYVRDREDGPEVRFIDLEKSRRVMGKKGYIRDLDALMWRLKSWSDTDRLEFVETYHRGSDSSLAANDLLMLIARRAARKARDKKVRDK